MASDASALLALWQEADAEPSHTDTVEDLTRLIAQDAEAVIVAEAAEGIVGSVMAAWDGWRGSIYRLAVAPGHRRQGLGRQLLLEAERRLTKIGAARWQAIVVETDPLATGFWHASGWERQTERVRFVKS
jgi:ribosomal protein S18 acetylase RimI-like enzyme